MTPTETAASALYHASTANDPVVHCNRFPTWDELTIEQKLVWIAKVPARRVRHKRRGTTYTVIGNGSMQSSDPAWDHVPVTVYRSDNDGRIWVRPTHQFEDGRFEEVSP